MERNSAGRKIPWAALFLVPAGFVLGVLAGLLLTNHQSTPTRADGEELLVPVAVSTVRVAASQAAAQAPAVVPTPPPGPQAQPTSSAAGAQPQAPLPQAPAPSQTYTVVGGDTLFAIAAQFNITVAALAQANNIVDTEVIEIGQLLVIPTP